MAGSDMFYVEGESPVLSLENVGGKKYRISHPPVFNQMIDLYATFLRKSVSAFERADNMAARGAIQQLCTQLRAQMERDDSDFARTQQLLDHAFKILIKSIAEESL